ncbi:MAG TPA: hypothetical protein VIF15_14755 [Polyangiaceae bacterium]
MDKRSRRARKLTLGAIVRGIEKRLGTMSRVTIANVDYTPQQLAQFFADELDSITTVEEAEAKRAAARLRERRTWSRNRRTHRAFLSFVRGAFAGDAKALAEFGLSLEKKAKKSAEVKARAVEKAQATRQARGTKGKRQKEKIRG